MGRDRFYCGLDVGSQRVKAGILKVKDVKTMELVGASERRTHGFKDASVSDLGEFSECIYETISEVAKSAGIKCKEVELGIGAELLQMRQTSALIPLMDRGSKVITTRDIKRVNEQSRLLGVNMEEEVLHDLPQYYTVDDINTALNPLGLYGRKLGVQSLVIVAQSNRIRNITKAVHDAGFDIDNLYFNSYASSEVILSKDQIRQGSILIDIGSNVSSVLIFKDSVLRYLNKIDIGGIQFSKSIAEALDLPFDLAEEIKKSHANASTSNLFQNEEILIKRESAYIPIKRQTISDAIAPNLAYLVDHIRQSIDESGLADRIECGIIVVGGGALLSGMIELIEQKVNLPVSLGKMDPMYQNQLDNPALFSSVVGLAQNGFRKTMGYSLSLNGHSHIFKNLTHRVRELYQEYF